MNYIKTLSLAVVTLIACGAGCASPASVPSAATSVTGRWSLVSFNGDSVPSGQSITFETDNRYSAKFCNSMSGSFALTNGVFVSTSTISTKMACVDDRMMIEQAFGKNLASGLSLSVVRDVLQLRGSDGSVFLFSLGEAVGTPATSSVPSTPGLKSFERPGDFSISYPATMDFELGKELSASLLNASVFKLSVPKSSFNPNDVNNFQEAFLVFSATNSAKINKDNFMAFTDIPGSKPSAAAVQFNGYNFSFTTTSDAGAGNFYRTEVYRTVYDGRYYQAEITLHTTNAQNYTPVRQEFTGDAYAPLRDVLRSIKFLP